MKLFIITAVSLCFACGPSLADQKAKAAQEKERQENIELSHLQKEADELARSIKAGQGSFCCTQSGIHLCEISVPQVLNNDCSCSAGGVEIGWGKVCK